MPISGYYYLEDFNAQKKLYDPNLYRGPDDKIFEDPIYIMDNGNVTGITVEEMKKEFYRRMNITPKYYDELLGQYIDTGMSYMNFTNDTNFIIFSSTHLTKFTAFFVPNNATFTTNNRFFYLKRPRILKYMPNYAKSWGVYLFCILVGLYILFLCILAIYDSQYRNKEALLEYIKAEVVQFSLHYKQNEDKNNYIPNIFRRRYDFRYFQEIRSNNNRIGNALSTNDDLKSTQNFWRTDKRSETKIGPIEEEPLDEVDLEEEDMYDDKPVPKSNFFHQGSVRQKKLTIEQKLRQKNKNPYTYNKNIYLQDNKQSKRVQRKKNLREIEYEDADEVRQQQLEEFAHIDLTFSEFLLINIISRSILINSYVIVSIFSPRWKKQSLLLTEHCIMIILASLFLTNDETIQGGSQSIKIFIISIVIMILTDFFMYIYSFFFFSFPTKSQRKLFNLVSNNHQLKIIKEWDKIENRMQKFEIIGMILSALIWIFCFYVSFGFTIVWKNQNNAFLITFAMCFGLNYIVGEFLIEFLIALLYLNRKHNSCFRWLAERLNNLRNIRCLSP